ncbi:hypothetical protein CL622_00785 [archaeon]|nr:hypothetical protein [archaeon]|tara:strand:- start:419 stop:979 length:561 start_codon:yes stop_codon:yes gene_type:complete
MDIVFYESKTKEVLSTHIILAKDPTELRKKVNASNEPLIIVQGGNDKINKESTSMKNVDILLDPDTDRTKDFMHHKNSGLTIQTAQLANKNEVAIGFSFSRMLDSTNRPKQIARMHQNVLMCRKYNIDMVLANFSYEEKDQRDLYALKSFGQILSMRTDEIIDALDFASRRLINKTKKINHAVKRS